MKYVYHGSPKGGMKILHPRMSTHGKKYVYAVLAPEVAVAFAAKASDIDFTWQRNNGLFIIVERWPGAFQKYYIGQEAYLYGLPMDTFHHGKTGREEEWVSAESVKVLKEKHIKDMYMFLIKAQKKGNIRLYHYENQPVFIKKLNKSDIIDKAKIRVKDKSWAKKYLPKIKELHPDIYEQIIE